MTLIVQWGYPPPRTKIESPITKTSAHWKYFRVILIKRTDYPNTTDRSQFMVLKFPQLGGAKTALGNFSPSAVTISAQSKCLTFSR